MARSTIAKSSWQALGINFIAYLPVTQSLLRKYDHRSFELLFRPKLKKVFS